MSTARDLIARSFRRARIKGVDQTVSAEEESDALATLNELLDSWWNERVYVFQEQLEGFSWGAGVASKTMGSGGTLNTTRPLKILGGYVRDGDEDYPLRVAQSRAEFDDIGDKSSGGIPRLLYYEPAYPLATVYLWPVPDRAYTVYMSSHKRLETFSAATEDVDLPPGYERLIVSGLGLELASHYGIDPPAWLGKTFSAAKSALAKTNTPTPVMQIGPSSGRYDIYSDTGA